MFLLQKSDTLQRFKSDWDFLAHSVQYQKPLLYIFF